MKKSSIIIILLALALSFVSMPIWKSLKAIPEEESSIVSFPFIIRTTICIFDPEQCISTLSWAGIILSALFWVIVIGIVIAINKRKSSAARV